MWGAEVQIQLAAYRRLFHFFRLTKALAPFLPGRCDHAAALLNLQTPTLFLQTHTAAQSVCHRDTETQARLCPAGMSIIHAQFHPHNVSRAVSHLEHRAVPMAVPYCPEEPVAGRPLLRLACRCTRRCPHTSLASVPTSQTKQRLHCLDRVEGDGPLQGQGPSEAGSACTVHSW